MTFGKTIIFVVVSLGLIASACTKKSNSDPLNGTSAAYVDSIELLSQQNDVLCANANDCPGYMAETLVKVSRSDIRSCASFLVAPDVMAMSSSCLEEDDLRDESSGCTDKISAVFPKTATHPAEMIPCSRMIKATDASAYSSDPILRGRDYAFFALTRKTNRPILRWQSDLGLTDGDVLTVWHFTHDTKTDESVANDSKLRTRSILSSSKCRAVQGSYLNPDSKSGFSSVVVLGDCPVEETSMGAPAVDSEGRVRAMVTAQLRPDLRSKMNSRFVLKDALTSLVYATNFACVPHVGAVDEKLRGDCSIVLEYDELERARALYPENSDAHMTICKWMIEMLSDNDVFHGGKLSLGVQLMTKDGKTAIRTVCGREQMRAIDETFESTVTFAPTCFSNPESIEERDNWLQRFWHHYVVAKDRIEIQYPPTYMSVRLNQYGKLEAFRKSEDKDVSVTFLFNLKRLLSGHATKVERQMGDSSKTFENIGRCSSPN